jgi:hypothetical protein
LATDPFQFRFARGNKVEPCFFDIAGIADKPIKLSRKKA